MKPKDYSAIAKLGQKVWILSTDKTWKALATFSDIGADWSGSDIHIVYRFSDLTVFSIKDPVYYTDFYEILDNCDSVEVYLENDEPQLSSDVKGSKLDKAGNCIFCGKEPKFIRMALVCETHGFLAGM